MCIIKMPLVLVRKMSGLHTFQTFCYPLRVPVSIHKQYYNPRPSLHAHLIIDIATLFNQSLERLHV